MRGSLDRFVDCTHELGIIPAHAGLTYTLPKGHTWKRDHPRACGAHMKKRASDSPVPGSSPRMRGSRYAEHEATVPDGIIPAHAGLTCAGCTHSSGPWDHPRACGAHILTKLLDDTAVGSSPRMRGSLVQEGQGLGWLGIIPAHAGLTEVLDD